MKAITAKQVWRWREQVHAIADRISAHEHGRELADPLYVFCDELDAFAHSHGTLERRPAK